MDKKNKKKLVLAVDDDKTSLLLLKTLLKKQGHNVIEANNGQMAKDLIKKNYEKIDLILLDRVMPGIDGLEVVKWLNNSNFLIKPPVIIVTASDSPEQITEGIDAGVFYYLTKPIEKGVLKSLVLAGLKESQQRATLNEELTKHRSSFKLFNDASFKIQTLEDAESLACFISNSFPNPYKILPGIAELLINAIEHGNFEISYEEKSKLVKEGTWREEIEKRSKLGKNKNKFANVVFKKEESKYILKISDTGNGFAWKQFLTVEQSRALDNHGRGIARANMLFTSLQYNEKGNEVVAIVDQEKQGSLEW